MKTKFLQDYHEQFKTFLIRSCQLIVFICLAMGTTTFAQTSFSALNSTTTENLLGVHFHDQNIGYVCGENGVLLKTTDAGSTWTALTPTITGMIWDMTTVPNSDGKVMWAVGENGALLSSTDAGATWVPNPSPSPNSFLFSIQCLDEDHIFIAGASLSTLKSVLIRSKDGGTTWLTNSTNAPILDMVMFANPNVGYAVGNNSSFTDGGIWKTTDGGATWASVHSTSKIINKVWCIDEDNVVAVGAGGQILTTADAGATWTDVGTSGVDLYGLRFKDRKHGYASGGDGSSNIILETADGGNTWTTITYAGANQLTSIDHAGENLYIVGDDGHIAKANVGVHVNSITKSTTVQISPNPANDLLTITNTESGKSDFTLTNITGTVVKHIALTERKTIIDIAALPAGMYIYTVSGLKPTKGKLVIN